MPKPLRESLSRSRDDGEFNGLYVFPSFKMPALQACDEKVMGQLAEGVGGMDLFSDDQDDLAAAVLESAHQLPFDPEGRIVLPPELVGFADIDGEVLFAGRGDFVFLWEPKAYEANRGNLLDRARARGATLKLPKGER